MNNFKENLLNFDMLTNYNGNIKKYKSINFSIFLHNQKF